MLRSSFVEWSEDLLISFSVSVSGMTSIIQVTNLSKQYRIGRREVAYPTLRDSLARALRSPLQKLGGRADNDEKIWALKDVSVNIEAGEVVGVIGRNGAGKSTFLKILLRITEPISG